MSYDEDYYERGLELGISGYQSYRWLPELTIPLAHEIVTQLGIRKSAKILDFGCAKGYLVKALRLLHHDAYGVDASDYAVEHSPEDVRGFLHRELDTACNAWGPFDWIIAKDVLEHIDYRDLPGLLLRLRFITKNLFAVVPLGVEGKYVIPEYEQDMTHLIRENLQWWTQAFYEAGFKVVSSTYSMDWVKNNWAHYEKGNGFFVAVRK